MRQSTIPKHARAGAGSELAHGIGRELRQRRAAASLTQTDAGWPLTRAYVSAVEHGRTVPSIPALALLLDRLGVTFEAFFQGVQQQMTVPYNPGDGQPSSDAPPAAGGGR
ncbi:MAG: helix-turn-helix domain-containing protein [Chloroflexota bacterium]